MIAVYKRELRSYLTSMIGYLFIFFILFLTGIYFSAYQLGAAYPRFEYTLSALTFVFLISVPILTMRVLAEERKQKTDQLLLTSPVSVGFSVWTAAAAADPAWPADAVEDCSLVAGLSPVAEPSSPVAASVVAALVVDALPESENSAPLCSAAPPASAASSPGVAA